MNFEEIMKKLENICEELEDETISLERAMELYEEGVRLSKMADDILTAAETRVRKISEDG